MVPKVAIPCIILMSCLIGAARGEAQIPEIRKSRTTGTHYLMMFDLTRANTLFPGVDPDVPASRSAAFKLRNGGQFEVAIVPRAFPVAAPGCESRIILRMPWTNSQTKQAAANIKAKEALFLRLEQLRKGLLTSVAVAIDLSPYVKEVRDDPPRLELTECNVFFRDVGGRYVDNIADTKP